MEGGVQVPHRKLDDQEKSLVVVRRSFLTISHRRSLTDGEIIVFANRICYRKPDHVLNFPVRTSRSIMNPRRLSIQ